MPWTSNSIFEARRNFVPLTLAPNSNIRGLCRRFNISANTGYQTLERYRAEGEKGLQDRSRAPHRTPLRCSKATELAVLSVRGDHPTWGGRRIASYLQLLGAVAVPAPSTITAILIRNGRLKTLPKESARIWLLVMLPANSAAICERKPPPEIFTGIGLLWRRISHPQGFGVLSISRVTM
jgi:hypothetical protein